MKRDISIHVERHFLAEDMDSVGFIALVDGKEIRCYITADALRKCCSSKTVNIQDSFLENQAKISAVAKKLLSENDVEGAAEFMIYDKDIS